MTVEQKIEDIRHNVAFFMSSAMLRPGDFLYSKAIADALPVLVDREIAEIEMLLEGGAA